MYYRCLVVVCFSFFVFQFRQSATASKEEEDAVEKWAASFGQDLWNLGMHITKAPDIKTAYKKMNARVLPTDGEAILNTIVTNVNTLLKRKMESVMCVIEMAEELAENFEFDPKMNYTYYNAKYSPIGDDDNSTDFDPEIDLKYYKPMHLSPNDHFYGLLVNTSYSSVHVPTDVYDQAETVRSALQWSEDLDDVFTSNYLSDPTMSWQYFGSSTGFLRHYPAFHWSSETDLFDCRTRFWFIEAATCTKDVVILIDNSGSMTGMRNTIARLTVNTILDTFSNNDFINIFSFNKTTKAVIPCFPADVLVQATKENVEMFKSAVNKLSPDDKADFPKAFGAAFSLLEKSRENKSCPGDVCNQAIMLVTDGVPDNLTEVFERYNWFENRTRIPVRVFTYLIGREVTNVREIQYMACLNRGYYVHIHSLEEVRGQVLKYIPVIARPLVLQAVEHPLTWTHSFVDGDTESQETSENYRFMTSISGPAFDRKRNSNNETRAAELLGVAGTDVLIRDIQRLTLPYKIGANGYAFMITNNGYLMFHPDLRPTSRGHLKNNYNSVDLTEVELLDDDNTEPRDPSPEILQLREMMVAHEEGTVLDLKVKFHYDNMRRIGAETRNYYFAPLNNTPFTLGLVLPHSYGNYWIKAHDEIRRAQQMGRNILSYFKGNWRVHPEWVYCDYHRSKDEWTPEDKLKHFLEKISSPSWHWKEQFPAEDEIDKLEDPCNRRIVEDDEYFCDKELMQLLVFDAKSTEGHYKTDKWSPESTAETILVQRYGVSVRFVATQGGLTRWQDIPEPSGSNETFGDANSHTLDEVWYRSAVLHHHIDPDAFVFSIPFDAGALDNITVTASYAIFPRDGGLEAPGSVVGFQFQHSALYYRFMEITSVSGVPKNPEHTCSSDSLDCYVIDGNGYIVLSETHNDTGRFFGEVEGAIMEAMVSKNIFRQVPIFDYQALCFPDDNGPPSGVDTLWTPIRHIGSLLTWFMGKLLWLVLQTNVAPYVQADMDPDYYDETFEIKTETEKEPEKFIPKFVKKVEKPKPLPEPCDHTGNLYLLQHFSKEGYHSATPVNCSRPFYMTRIKGTNLLLIVVNALHQSCYRRLRSQMGRIEYNSSGSNHPSCQKLNINALPRRRLSGCFNTHPLEEEIDMCGKGNYLRVNILVLSIPFLYVFHNVLNNFRHEINL